MRLEKLMELYGMMAPSFSIRCLEIFSKCMRSFSSKSSAMELEIDNNSNDVDHTKKKKKFPSTISFRKY